MSAPAPVPAAIRCNICDFELRRTADMQPVRDRGKNTGHVRCTDYAGCMLRSARARREQIGMGEYDARS